MCVEKIGTSVYPVEYEKLAVAALFWHEKRACRYDTVQQYVSGVKYVSRWRGPGWLSASEESDFAYFMRGLKRSTPGKPVKQARILSEAEFARFCSTPSEDRETEQARVAVMVATELCGRLGEVATLTKVTAVARRPRPKLSLQYPSTKTSLNQPVDVSLQCVASGWQSWDRCPEWQRCPCHMVQEFVSRSGLILFTLSKSRIVELVAAHMGVCGVPSCEVEEITGHSWRALGATLLYEKTGDIELVARVGGWKAPKLGAVMRYIRRKQGEVGVVAAVFGGAAAKEGGGSCSSN